MFSLSAYIDRDRKSAVDAERRAAFNVASKIYEPIVDALRGQCYELRHEVARLKVYEEFVLGRGRQYGALRRMRVKR